MYLPVKGHFFTVIVPEGKEQGTYQSSLTSIDANHLFISAPRMTENRLPVQLAPGTRVILDYRDAKDIPCRFETVVDELSKRGGTELLALKCPQSIERHQRRENVRIPISLPIEFKLQSETFTTRTNDLSGGGLSAWLKSEHQIMNGTHLEVKFHLNEGKQSIAVNAEAQVVSVQNANDEDLISIKFTAIDEAVRQKIIEFVFDRQILDIALRGAGASFSF